MTFLTEHKRRLETTAQSWIEELASSRIRRIEEIIKASLLFPYNVNLEMPKDMHLKEVLFDTSIFYKKSTLELIKDAFQYEGIWNRAVRIAELGEFGAPLFVLRTIEGNQRVALFFDHGKVFKNG